MILRSIAWLKSRPRRIVLLVLVVLSVLWLGSFAYREYRFADNIATIHDLGCEVKHSLPGTWVPEWLPDRLRQTLGRSKCGLNVTGNQFDSQDIHALAEAAVRLEDRLGWIQVTFLPLKDISFVKSIPALGNLYLVGGKIDDVSAIASATQLVNLKLAYVELVDSDLKHLVGLQDLATLDISGNPEITHEGIRHLTSLPHLQMLDLSACSVDTRFIPALVECKQLQRLKLPYTPTADELDEFRTALPNCSFQ